MRSAPHPADAVLVREGLAQDFYKRHRKDRARAQQVWDSLRGKARQIRANPHTAPILKPPRVPGDLVHLFPLRVIKGLPYAFRAVYTVFEDDVLGLVVSVEWLGSHQEHDRAFGYD